MSNLNGDLLHGVRAVLLDIEGTTTPISFVKETMFGFIRANLRGYIDVNYESDMTQMDIAALREQAAADQENGLGGVVVIPDTNSDKSLVIDAVVGYVLGQMDNDRKSTSLKQLQGHMWKSLFTDGALCAVVFDDVAPALQRLTATGHSVCIYSSGSVEAQKLLFGHSTSGNLLEFMSGFFDTTIGAKVEKESYCRIASQLDHSPNEILFLSDIPAELKAAEAAGMSVCLISRPGNAPLTDDDKQRFRVLTSFDELFLVEKGGKS